MKKKKYKKSNKKLIKNILKKNYKNQAYSTEATQ